MPGLGAGACTFRLPPEVIAAFDANGDGKLDIEDIKHMLRQMQSSLDADGDGNLDCDDVRLLCCPSSCAPKAARYETTAAHMDAEPARRQAECDGPDGAVSGEGGSSGETEGDEPQTQQPL